MTTEWDEKLSYFIGFYDALKWIHGKKPSKWFKEYNVEKHIIKNTKDKSLLYGGRL
jgi:hypothetical protein